MGIKKIVTTIYRDDETEQEYQFEPIDDTIELKQIDGGFELRYLTQDIDPESPDSWGDDSIFLVHYHRQFWIKNETCPQDVLAYIYTHNADDYDKESAEQVEKDYFVFSVSAYIHSGVSLSLGDAFQGRLPQGHYQFDVSHVGAVLAKKDTYKTKDKAKQAAESLVETWNQYLSGDVYCLVCEKLDKDKQSIESDIVGGYYGLDYAKESLKTEI